MVDGTRFAFGKNWAAYSDGIGERQLNAAVAGLRKLLPEGFSPAGKTFLDIGSGSGLHSVAACKLGFTGVTATDYDPDSVATTAANAAMFKAPVRTLRDDILASKVEGQFDVVYSWGVLHHTGDMTSAVRSAAALVRPGGLFVVALYVRTPFCGMWRWLKRIYCRSPRAIQHLMAGGLVSVRKLGRALKGRSNAAYSDDRGMNLWHDAKDWFGGYPYQSASHAEVLAMVGPEFTLEVSFNTAPRVGLFGTGCGEYVFTKR